MNKTIAELKKYEARGMFNQLPVVWKEAYVSTIEDDKGRDYIDFTSGIFVTNTGHSSYSNILKERAGNGVLYSYTFPTKEKLDFLKYLIKITPPFCEKACLFSAGTEATEAACKIMRIYGRATERGMIVSFKGAMHGKTYLAERLKNPTNKWLNWIDPFHIHLSPFPIGSERYKEECTLNNFKYQICGIIIESYQGWSGRFYAGEYIRELVDWAKKNDILVCFDEIQGGFGRTGHMFAYEHYNVEPDLLCLGKGLGGGVPISAVIGRKKLIDLPDDMSSTHSGNALCCSVALYNLKQLIDKNLILEARIKGNRLHQQLEYLKKMYSNHILEVNGKGLLGALIFRSKELATKICYEAIKRGLLLVYTGRESIKIGPPLIIRNENLDKGINILAQSIKKVIKEKT